MSEINPEKKALQATIQHLRENASKEARTMWDNWQNLVNRIVDLCGNTVNKKALLTYQDFVELFLDMMTFKSNILYALNARDLYASILEKLATEYDRTLVDLFEKGTKLAEEEKIKREEEMKKTRPLPPPSPPTTV